MTMIHLKEKAFKKYISEEQIQSAISKMADSLNKDYANVTEPVIFMVVLAGATPFATQLAKLLTFPIEWAFIKCSSYKDQTVSCGQINLELLPTISELEDRQVLVIEDIVDTGNTWEVVEDLLVHGYHAGDVRIATLCVKKDVYNKPLPVHYSAIEVENKFIVGVGLDYAGHGRSLKDIYIPIEE